MARLARYMALYKSYILLLLLLRRMFKLRMLSSRNCWLRKVCWLERRWLSGEKDVIIIWGGSEAREEGVLAGDG